MLNKTVPKFPRKEAPFMVFSTWEIHYACNYRCSYCHAPKPWDTKAHKAVYINIKDWIKIWNDLYEKYGSWFILMSGGEPSYYPDFAKLVIELSRIHFVEICTNLSWEVEPFIKKANPKMVKVGTSFHPEFADLDKFVAKVRLLKEHGFNPIVNFVPKPTFLPQLSNYKNIFGDAGIQFVLQPFNGEHEGRRYPQGYTDAEKEYFKIFKDNCNISTLDFKTTGKSSETKGKLCRMGQNYAFIHPDGEADRCCRDKSFSLGNIIKGTFKLLEQPVICNSQGCNCHRWMCVGKENEWVKEWSVPGRGIIKDPDLTIREDAARVALIQPPVWGTFDPPVALAQLSSCLKRSGVTVKSFDLNIRLYQEHREEYKTAWAIERSSFWSSPDNVRKFFLDNKKAADDFLNEVIAFNPDVVGFSVSGGSYHSTLELSRMLKNIKPGIKIVIGGPMFFVPVELEQIINNDYIDIVVFGEGEETFPELIANIKNGNNLDLVKGIAYKKEGQILKTQVRPLIKYLEQIPFLDFSDLSLDRYDPPGHLGKHISLMTSRGCVHNCVFCGPKAYWSGYRLMSAIRIYEEIKFHINKNPGLEHIEFLDLLFNGNMRNLNEFCDLMISCPLKEGLRWHANVIIRPEMTADVLLKMHKAGCRHLTYGIESGSQRVLSLMRKNYRVEDADAVLKSTREAGIDVTCNFMFGFPGETEDDFEQTLEFIKRNCKNITTAYPSRSFCTVEPYSYLQAHMEEFGMVANPIDNLYWESKDGRNNYPERMRRCEAFSSLAQSLGVSVGLGLQTSIEVDRQYNLGSYYESKEEYQKAADCFFQYLLLDPKNEVIKKRLEQIENKGLIRGGLKERDDLHQQQERPQVSFNWDIHWICNYRCPYCWFYGKWSGLKRCGKTLTVKQLIAAWQNIYDKYGKIKVSITGGEPFLYPGFVEFIGELSCMHSVEIITNLSAGIDKFVKMVNSNNVKVNPSFHPLFADFDIFVEKALLLGEKGFMQCISCVAWPPLISRIPFYMEGFGKHGLSLTLQSFFGEYKKVRYPEGYTEEDKKKILPEIGSRGGEPFQTEPLKTSGKMCAAGQRYGVIHPDGTVLRCGGINSSNGVSRVGNIFEDGFKLLGGPSPCTFEICPCNEWAFLLQAKEK